MNFISKRSDIAGQRKHHPDCDRGPLHLQDFDKRAESCQRGGGLDLLQDDEQHSILSLFFGSQGELNFHGCWEKLPKELW